MKKLNIYYWIVTGLLSLLMIFSAVPDIALNPQAVEMIKNHLGYPLYFLPFIGWAKLLGAIAIVIPGILRIKEWAYAGFMYDLIAAMYSAIMVGDPVSNWAPVLIGVFLIVLSYVLYHKRLKARAGLSTR
jgi:uncharacterized membrane protein YphA (DoxX/SURF4 family)